MQNVQDQEVLDVSEVKVCSPDHDYIELMVKVKEEDESDCVVDDLLKEIKESKFLKTKKRTPRKKKFAKQIADPQIHPDPFFNLSQLAEVSLAMEGRSEDQDLNQRVQQAAARAAKATEPSARPIPAILASLTPQPLPGSVVLPQQPMPLPDVSRPGGQRTMQIVLPDNASHIIICTNNNQSENVISSPVTPVGTPALSPANKEKSEASDLINPPAKNKGQQQYTCNECGKKYSTSSNLARHRQTHRYNIHRISLKL